MMDLQPVKGTRDFFPDQMRQRNWLFEVWRKVSMQAGFEEYDTCVLEHEELYIRKAGDEISQQLYSFEDKAGRRLSLRPEMTPSLARMILQHQRSLPLPVRWFSIPQCFRYERMTKGRRREHFQWNMDLIGLESEAALPAVTSSAKLDLNSATVQQLVALPGIGRAMAEAVVAQQPYTQLQELQREFGIAAEAIIGASYSDLLLAG